MNEKQLTVVTGPVYNPQVCQVVLNGVQADERLTPQLARRAVQAAAGLSSPATVWTKSTDTDTACMPRARARSRKKSDCSPRFIGESSAPTSIAIGNIDSSKTRQEGGICDTSTSC